MLVIGDGLEPGRLEAQAVAAGLTGVTFTGWQNHSSVARTLRQAQAFVFPSLRGFGGAAVLEAMTLGVVPVVADYGGLGELVGDAGARLAPSLHGASRWPASATP